MSSPLPFSPIPSWLDPTTEITVGQPESFSKLNNKDKAITFIMASFKALAEADRMLSTNQIVGVIANSIVETGWGRHWKGNNLGGWKIREEDVRRAKQATGKCPPWWRAEGHVLSGDPPVCYYRGFASFKQFYGLWLERFVPKESAVSHRYHKTGLAFWSENDWFKELCLAGYKGPVTQRNPEGSINTWFGICAGVKDRIAQYILGVTSDGIWGNGSKAACSQFQKVHGIPETGILNNWTLERLVQQWKQDGMKIPMEL